MGRKIDPMSRDWSASDIKEDPRFKICRKEMIISFAVWAIFAAALLICIYIIGGGDPLEYGYICAMPAWLFWETIICIVTIVVVAVVVDKLFKHMSLEAYEDDDTQEDSKK